MNELNASVIIAPHIAPPPEEHEVSAAWLLARHYNCTIKFLKPVIGYKIRTPDFIMNGQEWELKSPTGNAKTTIANNLINAKSQSPHIVFDSRRTKIPDTTIIRELRKYLISKSSIKKIIIITKNEKVLAIKK
jgi:hypothetical protein